MVLLFVMGALWAIAGCVMALSPELIRGYMTSMSAWSPLHLHLVSLINVVVGAVLLYYGWRPSPLRAWFLVIGLLTLFKGVTVFLPMDLVVRPYMAWWLQQSDLCFRALGAISALIGAAVCWATADQMGGGKRLLPRFPARTKA